MKSCDKIVLRYNNSVQKGVAMSKKKKYKDVVCRCWLAKETKNKVEKDGKVYYFCSPGCKEKFEKDPEKYLKLVG